MRTSFLLLSAVGLLALSPGEVRAENLVRNGDFEAQKDGKVSDWSLGSVFRVEGGAGLSGTRGLVYENASAKTYEFSSQKVKVRPGAKYRISAWVKTENLKTPKGWHGAMVVLDVYDRDGKYIGETQTRHRLCGTTDWTLLEGYSSAMPDNAASGMVLAMATRGCTGKAFFEDVKLEPLEMKPVEGVYSSLYRNLGADEDEKVTLTASLFVDPTTWKPDLYSAVFHYVAATGGVAVVRADAVTAKTATLTLPLERLAYGTYPIAFELESADGKVRDSASLMFTRTKERPRRKVWIDRHSRLIVDGKPFFPLGFYLGKMEGEAASLYGRAPFNAAISYHPLRAEHLDAFQKAGVKVIYNLLNYHPFIKHSYVPKAFNADSPEVLVASVVNRVKDHPALLAWYVNDEAPAKEKGRLARRQRLLERIDPDHPTFSVLYQIPELREHKSTADVIGTDPYPVNDYPISACSTWCEAAKESTFGGPVWQVPQAFDYAWFLGEESPKRGLPSQEEIVSMLWQPIACGANGLIAYSLDRVIRHLEGAERDAFTERYCVAAREVARFFDVLLSVEPAPSVADVPQDLRARAWRLGGDVHVLVVNVTRERRQATLALSERFSRAEKALHAGVELVDGNRLSVDLPALGVAMVKLR